MKTLKDCIKDCIKEHINESVWDIEDNVESDNKEFVIDDVKKFIEDNYNNISRYCEFIFDDKRGKYIVNCKQSVRFESEEEYLTNGLFEWGEVGRYFHCRGCENLKSLEGAPERVEWQFNCELCPNLETLKGGPKYVGGYFDCSKCPKLTTLEGSPEKVDGEFSCSDCIGLKSLKGAPEIMKNGGFDCSHCPNLESLEGAPKKIGGIFTKKSRSFFNCSYCHKLENLKGAPKEVGGNFYCEGPNLLSLDGIGKVKGKIISRFLISHKKTS